MLPHAPSLQPPRSTPGPRPSTPGVTACSPAEVGAPLSPPAVLAACSWAWRSRVLPFVHPWRDWPQTLPLGRSQPRCQRHMDLFPPPQNKLALLSLTTGGTAEMYGKTGVSGDFRYFLWPLQVPAAPPTPSASPAAPPGIKYDAM